MPKKQNNSSELARLLYNGKISPSDIDAESVRLLATELMNGALGGYGKTFKDLEPESIDYQILSKIEDNIHVFSGAKNFAQLQEMSALLRDKNGKLVPFQKYLKAVQAIDKTYNKNYLAAEYDLALQSAQQAEHWQRIQEEKDLFPFLQYNAILDGHETQLCHNLDGIIKPVDDPFWNTRFPPNHWRCRSVVDPLADDESDTTETPKDLPNLPDMFNNNVGKNGEIFPPSAPYFKLPGNEAKTVKLKIDYLIPHRWENFKKFEALKTQNNIEIIEPFNKASGGYLTRSKSHKGNEYASNMKAGKEFMKDGYGINLKAKIEQDKIWSYDAEFNLKEDWEFKYKTKFTNGKNSIQGELNNGNTPYKANVAIYLGKYVNGEDISRALYNALINNKDSKIMKVLIKVENRPAILITRQDLEMGRATIMLQRYCP